MMKMLNKKAVMNIWIRIALGIVITLILLYAVTKLIGFLTT